MFERYNEYARRAIFFARYAASQSGSPTIETEHLLVGLVREAGEVKLFGSGLISSSAEALHALSPECERRPFVLDQVLDTAFQIDHLQPVLYVVDGFDELFEAVEALG